MIEDAGTDSERSALANRLELERLGIRAAEETAEDLRAAIAGIDASITCAVKAREMLAIRLELLE